MSVIKSECFVIYNQFCKKTTKKCLLKYLFLAMRWRKNKAMAKKANSKKRGWGKRGTRRKVRYEVRGGLEVRYCIHRGVGTGQKRVGLQLAKMEGWWGMWGLLPEGMWLEGGTWGCETITHLDAYILQWALYLDKIQKFWVKNDLFKIFLIIFSWI